MKKATLLALGLLAAPAMVSAATAWTRSSVNLRAGPDVDYPYIATLPPGYRVEVYGCVNDWSWCDVSSDRYRGWMSASYLNYEYQGRRVPIRQGGSMLGLQILSFSLGVYWDEHYRGKAWYSQRGRMEERHPRHAAPTRADGDHRSAPSRGDRGNAVAPTPAPNDRPPPGTQRRSKEPESKKKPQDQGRPDRDRDRDDDRREPEQPPP